jgi:hypothetical protein
MEGDERTRRRRKPCVRDGRTLSGAEDRVWKRITRTGRGKKTLILVREQVTC